jgi:uncharacterized protein (TIGR02246 family)
MSSDSGPRSAIEAANEKFMAAFGRGDAAAVAALYTKDARLAPPNSDYVGGTDAIRQFWQGAMQLGIKGAKLETVDVEAAGDASVELGRYTLLGDGGQTLDNGKYLVVWKKDGGDWKLHRDIWNTSRSA